MMLGTLIQLCEASYHVINAVLSFCHWEMLNSYYARPYFTDGYNFWLVAVAEVYFLNQGKTHYSTWMYIDVKLATSCLSSYQMLLPSMSSSYASANNSRRRALCLRCVRPSVRPLSVNTCLVWRDICVISGRISIKLTTNILRVGWNCWNGF